MKLTEGIPSRSGGVISQTKQGKTKQQATDRRKV
jgi:hypothetical protein